MSEMPIRDGNTWLFGDGKRLPVVSGGSDTPIETPPAPDAAPAAAPEAAPAGDVFERQDGEIDAGYIERLKKESISHRLKAKELEEQFSPWKESLSGFDADQAEAVRNLLDAAKRGDVDAISAILGLDAAALPPAGDAPPPEYLTAADVERILGERESKAQAAQFVKEIESEAKTLGYDKESNDYVLLLKIANEKTGGDLKAAHEQVQAWKQSLVDDFVSKKANGGATPPPAAGGPPSGEREILTLEDAKRAALARFGASPVSQG